MKQIKVSEKFHQWLKLTAFKEGVSMQEKMTSLEKSMMSKKK